jgi:membrane-associated phospholipid phosphatase
VLIAVLVLNSAVRDYAQQVSLLIGWNITPTIEAIEGDFVTIIQSFQTELLTAYFSYIYVYGYVFLLVFPVLAYIALSDRKPFQRLIVAYSLNYFIGLALYVVFIAYGPRNVEIAQNLLYDTNAQYQFLTSEVNVSTNVFPSLHTSLSATVAGFAYRTRDSYPIWLVLGSVIAVSIIISTMYLGIHWGTDVVAGLGLAALSIYLAERYID